MVVRILDLAVQLAVGEGAGAAFTELDVGLGVEHALAPQAPGILGALAYFLATLGMIGRKPICASKRPAKMPQGPKPTTIGRSCRSVGA